METYSERPKTSLDQGRVRDSGLRRTVERDLKALIAKWKGFHRKYIKLVLLLKKEHGKLCATRTKY